VRTGIGTPVARKVGARTGTTPEPTPREVTMIAHIGDRIVLESTHLGEARRIGVITAVGHPDGSPPYEVRWAGSDRTTLIFPGAEARIESAASAAAEQPEVTS
jgi:Domain of unknown function (DUF1918)